jgi:uncharacterized protein YgiM (DUF1202 family)
LNGVLSYENNEPYKIINGIMFLVFSSTVQAEIKYVVEYIQVNARTGSSVEHKIVTMLESGQKVQVFGVDKDWSLKNREQEAVLS